ncbi:circularly permuted type 2 ATP-grasp protein [Brachybacterium sp. EF45031]|uniref:circularly permuted type 2 ATP-grasp protein n=1 Tax=Brachybacterium sillae TaxID=2810536 RepID=UPI00217CE80E|nr:circularly permuted type 2 ATP-grasp protein [Brachybacterium sillae]MCS6711449.1 circularly permuted type 2 ATP-grasp protein [Brachybacterium sillae]
MPRVTADLPLALQREIDELGGRGLRAAAAAARREVTAEVPGQEPPLIDPVPVVLTAGDWQELTAGLVQRARLLDAIHADLYGARTILAAGVAPAPELFADAGYVRAATSIPPRGPRHLVVLAVTVVRTSDGHWAVRGVQADVPTGAGLALEMRRVISRTAPTLLRSTALQRLHPFYDRLRSALGRRTGHGGLPGRAVVLTDGGDARSAFDHRWLANLLGWPTVTGTDLAVRDGELRLQGTGVGSAPRVDVVVRMVPSTAVDPLELGPGPFPGVAGLVETARRGEVEVVNPVGAGILENRALAVALPDICRHLLHEDLLLPTASSDQEIAEVPSLGAAAAADTTPSTGAVSLVGRPVELQLMVMDTGDGFAVLPGGIARTLDDAPEAWKDVWVLVAEEEPASSGSAPADPAAAGPPADGPEDDAVEAPLIAPAPMTRRIASDLFWFGRYLERVDFTARLLRTVEDHATDLGAESSATARTALEVLLHAVTDATTTFPGFHEVDTTDRRSVREELLSVALSPTRLGALGQSFTALEGTARNLRDLVTDDIWGVLSLMSDELRTPRPAAEGEPSSALSAALSRVVMGTHALSGAVGDTMVRSAGRDLLDAGRRIERASATLRLLRATLSPRHDRAIEARVAAAVAATTGTASAYRRTHHAALRPRLLLDMLLHDMTLPRSVAAQLEQLVADVERLPETAGVSSVPGRLRALRQRVAGWNAAQLLAAPAEDGPIPSDPPEPALAAEIEAALGELRELSRALEEDLFSSPEMLSPWGFDDV